MKTLLLDQETWDLCVDASGNIAVADEPYSLQQEVISALKLHKGENRYDITRGIPYLTDFLGQRPTLAAIRFEMIKAAKDVDGVIDANVVIARKPGRTVAVDVQYTDFNNIKNRVVL